MDSEKKPMDPERISVAAKARFLEPTSVCWAQARATGCHSAPAR